MPASTSNLGAGFDCLGLALDIWLEARLFRGSGDPVYTGTLSGLRHEDDLTFHMLGVAVPHDLRLEVYSEIPVSRGLGSSAAATVAGLVLELLLDNRALDRQAVFHGAREKEGHPDNAGAAVYGGLVLSGHRPTPLGLSDSLGIALALPEQLASTREARAILPAQLSREDTVAQASRAAALVLGLTSGDGDLIGYGMTDHIAVPHRKQLIDGYEDAVQAGREAGAHGVTISGAGSGIVAVSARHTAEDVAHAMAQALTLKANPATALTPAVAERGFEVTEGGRAVGR